MDISQVITDFLAANKQAGKLTEADEIYIRNRLLALLALSDFENCIPAEEPRPLLQLLDKLIEFAVQSGIISAIDSEKEQLESAIMDLFVPLPSELNQEFQRRYERSPQQATDFFHEWSKASNYIKTRELARNIRYQTATSYGDLEITINLAKPEKDPKQIALEKNTPAGNYPTCLLCMENEGYLGNSKHPARTNHRIIQLELAGEPWGFQFSPYAYYEEHSIFLAKEHRPMQIDRQTFANLLGIVEQFPHYFVGSNADLPIVGGSILTHDHYQGGAHNFPMEQAEVWYSFEMTEFPEIEAEVLHWPLSVIRLRHKKKDILIDAAVHVFNTWRNYNDESASIIAETNQPHNTVTPIARQKTGDYELDIVLRNNRTSAEFPDGIFHPHPNVQHIKKENIGLIEVMGLAILPTRLKEELEEVRAYWLNKPSNIKAIHLEWADTVKAKQTITEANSQDVLKQAVAERFLEVLTDAGVFKQTTVGKAAFQRFTTKL